MAKGLSEFLKGILNSQKLVGKLVLTHGLISCGCVSDDPSSALFEMGPCLHEKPQKRVRILNFLGTCYNHTQTF